MKARKHMKEKIEEVIKVGDKFKITFYPQNTNADNEEHQLQPTTRLGTWTRDCLFGIHKKFGYGYIKFFDEEKKGIRCATTFYKRAIDIFLNDNNYRWKEGK